MVKEIKNIEFNVLENFFFCCVDLRQDMLALQFIQMIDTIWKSNELDLRFDYLF